MIYLSLLYADSDFLFDLILKASVNRVRKVCNDAMLKFHILLNSFIHFTTFMKAIL